MSGKLDQSLDEILSTQKRGTRTRRVRGGRRAGAVVAPTAGVRKTSARPVKVAAKAVPTGPSATGSSKIVVSNLPEDVNEGQIKEYFVKSIGPIRKVEISYGPNGRSRGIANVIFSRPDGASKALTTLNGLLVDKKPMKIEIVVDASQAAAIPPPRGLKDRISQSKSAAATKSNGKATTNGASTAVSARGKAVRGRGRATRGGRSNRPAKKTAEELDSEMADYFDTGNTANGAENATATNGAAPAAADAMEDDVL